MGMASMRYDGLSVPCASAIWSKGKVCERDFSVQRELRSSISRHKGRPVTGGEAIEAWTNRLDDAISKPIPVGSAGFVCDGPEHSMISVRLRPIAYMHKSNLAKSEHVSLDILDTENAGIVEFMNTRGARHG
jgi:hypothetical protein